MKWTDIMTMLISFIAGGGLVSILTIRSKRKIANAEAQGKEIDNVQEVITIWKDIALSLKNDIEQYKIEMKKLHDEVECLRRALNSYSRTNRQIIRLINEVTTENLEETKEKVNKLNKA